MEPPDPDLTELVEKNGQLVERITQDPVEITYEREVDVIMMRPPSETKLPIEKYISEVHRKNKNLRPLKVYQITHIGENGSARILGVKFTQYNVIPKPDYVPS